MVNTNAADSVHLPTKQAQAGTARHPQAPHPSEAPPPPPFPHQMAA